MHQPPEVPYPRSRLSSDAHNRIDRVCRQARVRELETQVAIETRWRVEAPEAPVKDIYEYISKGEAKVELDKVKVECARLIFPVVFEEYRAAGISGVELLRIAELEIDGLVSGFNLSPAQHNLLSEEARLLWDVAEAQPDDDSDLGSGASLPTEEEAIRGQFRSRWLDDRYMEREWTSDMPMEQAGGPRYNTMRRFRSGRKSTRDKSVRLAIAKTLNCSFKEVPE
jgi:hypothetical protein